MLRVKIFYFQALTWRIDHFSHTSDVNKWIEQTGVNVESIQVFPHQALEACLVVVIYSPKVQLKDERVPDLLDGLL
ncbi:MAG: hypothetical protein IMW89_06405 [Ktedonobacteraceae bacterium]|nr:hypothetical protein [Ktedonobacteraceae bacterium]